MNSLSTQERVFHGINQAHPDLFSDKNEPLEASAVGSKPVHLDFSRGALSSDAGLLLLKEVDEQIGLTEAAAAVLSDARDSRYTLHSTRELLRQCVYQIAAGYEDGNDSNALRFEPIIKMAAGRLPLSGVPLASQPTISRFQNRPSRAQLYRMATCIFEQFIASYDEAPEIIVLDFDDTDSKTYGDQQLTLFNAYYNSYCYMPLHVYEGLSGKLITTVLKPTVMKGLGVLSVLRRLVKRLRKEWPHTLIVYRGDSQFTKPEVMDFMESEPNCMHVSGLTANAVLKRLAAPVIEETEHLYKRGNGGKVERFHSLRYKAGSWSRYRRVVVKVDVGEQGTNVRYVVTDIDEAPARSLYQKIYCNRARAENFIKDHKLYLHSDRASCHRFEANQFRLFLHSLAYILFDTLRREVLRGTEWGASTIETLRLKLIKVGARVRELKTKIKIELPTACPLQGTIRQSFLLLAQLRPG
ncbi:MAG: IS1380 family transposase [Rhodothermia bacterium]|nr:MAG: IS1380 family transposase [Rhodothermia bacterium]